MVTIPAKTVMAMVIAVDEVLPDPAPKVNKGKGTEMEQNVMETRKLNKLFENLDLSGITEWFPEE